MRISDWSSDVFSSDLVRLFDGNRAHQHRLAALARFLHGGGDGRELVVLVLVELVVLVDVLHRQVRGNGDDVELVDVEELGRLGDGGSGLASDLRKIGRASWWESVCQVV